jgi:hypothetical protein
MRVSVQRIAAGLLLAGALALGLGAQTPPAPLLAPVTPEVHAQRMAALKGVLAGCVADPALCTAERVGADERVQINTGTITRIRLEWLRVGVHGLSTEKGDQRKALAADLSIRLARLETPAGSVPPAQVQQARTQFDQVLAAKEFQKEQELTWLQRKWQDVLDWLDRVLGSSFDAVTKAPVWIKYFFEALLFIVPAVLLLLWLMRQVREDGVHPSSSSDAQRRGTLAPQTEWLALADKFAQQNDWRQAIHALYWATIAGFESRHVWRTNPTRTPRDYLRLLQPGSAARSALAEQTRLFELTWYGYRSAIPGDYERALQLQSSMESR